MIERLDGTYSDGDPVTGQFPLYGKVAGVIVTGNEDGAHDICAQHALQPDAPGLRDSAQRRQLLGRRRRARARATSRPHGDRHRYTNRTALYLAHNLVWMAGCSATNPIPTNLNELIAEAETVSR